jgi:site-specific DNA-cytosine methylase
MAHGGLDAVLGSLAELGLDAEWDVFSAGACGAGHRRARIFILGWSAEDVADGRRRKPELSAGRGPRSGEAASSRASSQPHGRGQRVADSSDDLRWRGKRREEAGTGPDGQRRRRPSGSSESLADSDGGGLEGERKQERSGIESPRGDEPDRSGDHGGLAWEGVGNAWAERLQGLESTGPTPGTTGRAGIPPFPPGPADADTWRAVLERHPALAPAIEDMADPSVFDESKESASHEPRGEQPKGRGAEVNSGIGAAGRAAARPWEGKAEPELRGLAHGLAPRVERLRTAGNGVVPLVAARAFITLARRAGIA